MNHNSLIFLISLILCLIVICMAFAEWLDDESAKTGGRPPIQKLRKWAGKIWFWLTCHRDCAWCKRRIHDAWLPMRQRMPGGKKLPKVSHTICPSCVQKVESKVELSVEREARRMAEIRDRLKEKISQEIYSKRHALTNNH